MHAELRVISKAGIILLGFGCGLAACGRTGSTKAVPDAAVADLLWLPPEAVLETHPGRPVLIKNGRSIYVDGSADVVFSVAIPCDEVAAHVTEHFAHTAWRPRPTQWLNPGVATSFGGGCERQSGGVILSDPRGRPLPSDPFMEWRGEWENGRGDILTYLFGGMGQSVRGVASYLPRELVDAGRRKLRR